VYFDQLKHQGAQFSAIEEELIRKRKEQLKVAREARHLYEDRLAKTNKLYKQLTESIHQLQLREQDISRRERQASQKSKTKRCCCYLNNQGKKSGKCPRSSFKQCGKRSQKERTESDFKAKKNSGDQSTANRSFTSATVDSEAFLKKQRSQSYTEGKGSKHTIEIKRFVKTGLNGKCSSDEQSSKQNEELIEVHLDHASLDNVVREGRYFLGENLGRITRDIDGSRNEIDTLDDDELEWDDELDRKTEKTIF